MPMVLGASYWLPGDSPRSQLPRIFPSYRSASCARAWWRKRTEDVRKKLEESKRNGGSAPEQAEPSLFWLASGRELRYFQEEYDFIMSRLQGDTDLEILEWCLTDHLTGHDIPTISEANSRRNSQQG